MEHRYQNKLKTGWASPDIRAGTTEWLVGHHLTYEWTELNNYW
jgi:hypothetical protein